MIREYLINHFRSSKRNSGINDRIFFRLLSLVLIISFLSACGSSGSYVKTTDDVDQLTSFQQADQDRFAASEPVMAWWEQFNDPQLTDLVGEAIKHNYDIQIAMANVYNARALLREAGADRFPTIGTSASYARQRLSEEGITGKPADRTVDNYNAGFDAFWEIDLFGRVGQRIASARAASEQSIAELHNVYVIVAAEVARTYVELRGAQYRLDIAQRNEQNQKKTYELIQEMAEGGRSTNLDIARAKTLLEQTRSTIPPLEAEVIAAINRLGVLSGHPPNVFHNELQQLKPLPSLPATISIGDPQALLRRRPDVRAAEQGLLQATALYHLAVAEFYPEISFSGALGFAASSFGDWASGGAFNTSIGPSLSWRILDFKRVRAEIDQADAQAQIQLATFEKVILQALEEVETSLVNFTKEDSRRKNLIEAAKSSATAAELAKVRFEEGLDSFLDVLDAERTQLEAEDALALGEIQTALNLIAIYKAMGGGWQIISEW